jgi:hypothetical protein
MKRTKVRRREQMPSRSKPLSGRDFPCEHAHRESCLPTQSDRSERVSRLQSSFAIIMWLCLVQPGLVDAAAHALEIGNHHISADGYLLVVEIIDSHSE